jgi:predicted permease
VLGATAALSILTGLLFGLAPALQATRFDIVPALKGDRADQPVSSSRRFGLGPLLVATQIAFTLLLLVAAGLFGRTLANLDAIQIGFNRDNVLLFTLRPSAVGYKGTALNSFFEDVRERLGHLPGVQDVGLSNQPLPMGGGTMAPAAIDGVSPAPLADGTSPRTAAVLSWVGSGFFKTMQIPIAAGREFTARDDAGAPQVVIVNHQFARLFGLDNPVGRTLALGTRRYDIVGVVDDALAFALKEERRPVVYFSYLQASSPAGQMTYELRTVRDPLSLAGAVREMVRQVDTRVAIHEMQTQAVHIDQAISREITLAKLGSLLAGLALVIACVGLYGSVSFNVARRTSEIGIRMALGAPARRIVGMVLGEVLLLASTGLIVGLALSVAGSRYVKSLLYGVGPNDPVTVTIAVSALLACGMIAAVAPARRASQIDPMRAMRRE